MSNYLDTYLQKEGSSKVYNPAKAIENACFDPTQAQSFPIRSTNTVSTVTVIADANASDPYTAFPSNTAQFQDKVHLDFGSNSSSSFAPFSVQGQGQGHSQHSFGHSESQGQGTIDMSTYLTQMNMNGNNTNNSTMTQGFGSFDYDYARQGMAEAYISPESYNSNSYASSSRNYSGSSKTTPESATLVDPTSFSYQNTGQASMSKGSGQGVSSGISPAGMGDFIQATGEGRFAQLSEYFDGSRN